jgi:tetratricopeptide (TPR) repeat protein
MRRRGPDSESLGVLGRIHKDRYKAEKNKPEAERDDLLAEGHLDAAIEAYVRGVECDPRDYYPGINAVTLLIHKGTEESLAKAAQFILLVKFALARQGGAADDYWQVATLLEAACCERDWKSAVQLAQKALAAATKSFMAESTLGNLLLLQEGFARANQPTAELDKIVKSYTNLVTRLGGIPAKAG